MLFLSEALILMIEWAMTGSKSKNSLSEMAIHLATELSVPIINRNNQGLDKLKRHYHLQGILVEEKRELTAYYHNERLVFHPGMTVPRVKLLAQQQRESIVEAMALSSGDTMLDCTMGLANDALLASVLVGSNGQVDALEKAPVIYAVTAYGLQCSLKGSVEIQQAMRRIHPFWGDYQQFLPQMKANRYDLVYFDPMFDHALTKSVGLKGLRPLADYTSLSPEMVKEAVRVAKKRVVVKYRRGSQQTLDFDYTIGGKYSSVVFGIIEKKGGTHE